MAWKLPCSSGPFPVGCLDIITKTGLDSTFCRLYYPTTQFKKSVNVCPLWMGEPEYGNGFAKFLKIGSAGFVVRWMFGSARVPVYWQGPFVMPEGKEKLPLVLFSHGLGGNRLVYSYIAYEIASQGFMVAALEHRDRSASMTYYLEDGKKKKYDKTWLSYQPVTSGTPEEKEIRNNQVYTRAKEITKLMDSMEKLNDGTLNNILDDNKSMEQFQGKIDTDKCAVIGHSFGGATMITSLAKDQRFKAGVALDVWMFPLDTGIYKTKIERPLLFINSQSFQWKANIAGIRKLDCDVTGCSAERKMTTLLGAVHHTQCDFPFLLGSGWLSKTLKFRGEADPKVANDMNMKLILCFLGKHLGLQCAGEVDNVVAENSSLIMSGTNVEIDEERLKESKDALKSSM